MLLNPALISYNVGDRVVLLALVHDYHGEGEARALCGDAGIMRDHLRREGRLILVEGYVTYVTKGSVNVRYCAWPQEDRRNRDYGKYDASFAVTQRGMQTAVTMLQAYRNYIGQPGRLTQEQLEYAEQFVYPVPVASTSYIRLLTDVRAAMGVEGALTVKDQETTRTDAARLGIEIIQFPYDELDGRVDGVVKNNINTMIDAYQEWCEARNNPPRADQAEAAA